MRVKVFASMRLRQATLIPLCTKTTIMGSSAPCIQLHGWGRHRRLLMRSCTYKQQPLSLVKSFRWMEEHMQANGDRNGLRRHRERLAALGIQLPTPPTPLGNYVETSLVGTLLFTSGILPFVDGKLLFTGRLGGDLTVEQGQEAARYAALNALAAASHFLGDVDRLQKVVRVGIALATIETFTQHAAVADGASDLFVQLFGKEQGHTRLVVGASSLPVRSPVVLDAVFEVVV